MNHITTPGTEASVPALAPAEGESALANIDEIAWFEAPITDVPFYHPRSRVLEDGSLEIWQVPTPEGTPQPQFTTTSGSLEMSPNTSPQPINPADYGYGPQVLKSLSDVDAKMHAHPNPAMPKVGHNAHIDGLKITLFRMACDELVQKKLRPGTRNFRRMFKKRTGFSFEQMQADVIAINQRVRALIAAQQAANPTADPVEAVSEQLNAETAAAIAEDKGVVNVADFGAVVGDDVDNTAAIQAAIDHAAETAQ